jgi:hypothetical protein
VVVGLVVVVVVVALTVAVVVVVVGDVTVFVVDADAVDPPSGNLAGFK